MTKDELLQKLDYVDHTREKRGIMAQLTLNRPDILPTLFEIAFENRSSISDKAIWVIEYAVKQNVSLLLPHIEIFCQNLHRLKHESTIRPAAKMSELLLTDYYSKKDTKSKRVLTKKNLEQMATACFDWLIGPHKVAPKAHSMTCLYLLGRDFDWIHPELKMVIEQNYATGSAAYKARGRKVLGKLK